MNIFYSLTRVTILLVVLMSFNLVFAGTTGKVKGHISDKQTGEAQERTEWHRIVIFGKLGEIASQYLKKGSQAYFEGKIKTSKWKDQSGNDRCTTEIVASEMQMLGSKPGSSNPD